MHGPAGLHDPMPTGPADELFLQDPSTASSGRKLMTEIFGGSYTWFGEAFLSSSINPPSSKILSPASTTTPAGSRGLVIQDGKQHLRASPFPNIDFLVHDSLRRFLDGFVMKAILAKIAFPVCWHLEAQSHRPEVCDLTKKINR